jgi:hypothetical protein
MFACIYSPNPTESALAEFAYAFSPVVEESSRDTVILDVTGCEFLFGSAYELAIEIRTRAQKPGIDGGLEAKVNVALAANPDAALHAAKKFRRRDFYFTGGRTHWPR